MKTWLLTVVLLQALLGRSGILPPVQQWPAPLPLSYSLGAVASAHDGGAVLLCSLDDDDTEPVLVRVGPDGLIIWERCVQERWTAEMEECTVVSTSGNKLWEYIASDFSALNLRLLDNGQLLFSFANSSLLLSANGQFIATHIISPPGTGLSTLSRAITPDGGIIGYNRAQASVVRYNGTNIVWSKPYTDFTEVHAATRTGGYIAPEIQAFPAPSAAIMQTAPDALTAKPRLGMDRSFATNSGAYHLELHGVSNHFYAVDRTMDFVSWAPLSTNFLGSNSLSVSITVSNSATFFRARLVP